MAYEEVPVKAAMALLACKGEKCVSEYVSEWVGERACVRMHM